MAQRKITFDTPNDAVTPHPGRSSPGGPWSPDAKSRVRIVVIVWALVAGGGLIGMNLLAARPGDPGKQMSGWPAKSALNCDAERSTLFLFAHPQCPCTRASLESVMRLQARCHGRLKVTIVFVEPSGAAFDSADSPILAAARDIPGADVHVDPDCSEARRFGVRTSGHVLLYDKHKNLLFSGGMTIARGHNGDNAGLAAVESWVLTGRSDMRSAPVHGCSLYTDRVTEGDRS